MSNSLKKVVIRLRSGEVQSGFAREDDLGDAVRILDRKGKERTFKVDDLKAVFFVKDFQGDPEYRDLQFLGKQDPSGKVWVRLELFDGEVMEGRVRNDVDLLRGDGIRLWPSDKDTNNDMAFVVRSAIKKFAFLCNP